MKGPLASIGRVASLVVILALLLGSVGAVYAPVSAAPPAALTAEDEALLFQHLPILASESNTESADICTNILGKPEYTTADWANFFGRYFNQYPFTDKLFEYLTWPSFWATPAAAQLKLQEAMISVMAAKIQSITRIYGPNMRLGPTLAANADLRQTLGNAHRWMMDVALNGRVSAARRQTIFNFYITHVTTWPQYWSKTAINTTQQPAIAPIAMQIHANLREFVSGPPENVTRLATALRLQGRYADLWYHFNLLIYDNNGLDAAQLEFLHAYFSALPRGLRLTRGISVADFLHNDGPYVVQVMIPGVNIFSTRIGGYRENPFPPDVAARYCDGFVEVVAHETNHSVFAQWIEKTPSINNEHKRLINQAGTDQMNYLRSMVESGYFYYNPQEFFASTANQWFCSSAKTFQLGMARYRAGIPYPLDQAFFFAQIYAYGTGQTQLYTTDLQGGLVKQSVPLYKDGWGRTTGIAIPNSPVFVRRGADSVIAEAGARPPVLQTSPVSLAFQALPNRVITKNILVKNVGSLGMVYDSRAVSALSTAGLLDLSGQAGVRVEDSPSLDFTNKITIEAWVNPRTWVDGFANNGRILQKGYSDNQYRLTIENAGLLFDLTGVGRVKIENWKPPLNTWTHLAATYDGQAMRIFVNGALAVSQPATGKIAVSNDLLYIGNKDLRLVDSLIGQMEEVRLWSVARTQTQILAYRDRTVPPTTPGLVGYWQFNQAGSTSVADSTANGNTGKIEGPGRQLQGEGPIGWLTLTGVRTAVVRTGSYATLTAKADTRAMRSGVYNARIILRSNDPLRPSRTIPVSLTVLVPPAAATEEK